MKFKYKHLINQKLIPNVKNEFDDINKKRIPANMNLYYEHIKNKEYLKYTTLKNFQVDKNINDTIIPIWNEEYIGECIIDTNFKEEHLLSGLNKFIIANQYTPTISKFIFIYVLQQKSVTVDLSTWDYNKYYELFLLDKEWKIDDDKAILDMNDCNLLICENYASTPLGYHVSKKEKEYPSNCPYQIFLSKPKGRSNIKKVSDVKKKVEKSGQKCFVHDPYIYNLCKTEDWITEGLKEQFIKSQEIGAIGMVVHLGISKDISIPDALNNQLENIKKLLEIPNIETLLLIETQAGEGNDVCCSPDEILEIINHFNNPRLKICLDTCHVFSVGYDPAWFLNKVLEHVKLVHYNDSAEERGSSKDRHALAGNKYIGVTRMINIKEICINNKIPMVIE